MGAGVPLCPTEGMGQHSPGIALGCLICATPRGCMPGLGAEGGGQGGCCTKGAAEGPDTTSCVPGLPGERAPPAGHVTASREPSECPVHPALQLGRLHRQGGGVLQRQVPQ